MRITKENIDKFIRKNDYTGNLILDCSYMNITHIDYISQSITNLYCDTNQLTKLPKLPDGLEYLICGGNKLTELPELPKSLTYLNCGSNKLTELPELPDNLKHLYCNNNNLPYKITSSNIKEHNQLIKRKRILNKLKNIEKKEKQLL